MCASCFVSLRKGRMLFMIFFFALRRLIAPILAGMMTLLLPWSGCTARQEIAAAAPETVPEQRETMGYLLAELEEDAIHRGDLILVNGENPYHFPEVQELVKVSEHKSGSYWIRSMDLTLMPAAMEAVNAMLDDYLAAGNSKTINLVAAWRSAEAQQHLYDQSVVRGGAEHAGRYVALPGASEHHSGLAVDFSLYFPDGTSADFTGEGECRWIVENCHRYGLIVRYREEKESITGIAGEPWHFRYVGNPHAQAMTEMGLCLEEYIDYLHTFPYGGDHLFLTGDGGWYEVWYEAGSAVHVPVEGTYTVSGDNVGGLIVTRKLLDEEN